VKTEWVFYRVRRRWADLEGLLCFLSMALILVRLASMASTSQHTLTMDALTLGIWAAMTASAAMSWMRVSIPSEAVAVAAGGQGKGWE
jgi:uncharacterized membrane protein YeiH